MKKHSPIFTQTVLDKFHVLTASYFAMPDKFQNKYRIPSARLQQWDYRWAAAYFFTICTQNRSPFFGHIENGKMMLSGAGLLADVFWHEIKHHTANIELGAFVVMPNHVHGILILNGSANGSNGNGNVVSTVSVNESSDVVSGIGSHVVSNVGLDVVSNVVSNVETRHALSLKLISQSKSQSPPSQSELPSSKSSEPLSQSQPPSNHQPNSPPKTIGQQRFQSQGKNSVSSIIGSYKSAVTKHANRLQLPFAWQPRFHDHIIRSAEEYNRIAAYIQANVANWQQDTFYQ